MPTSAARGDGGPAVRLQRARCTTPSVPGFVLACTTSQQCETVAPAVAVVVGLLCLCLLLACKRCLRCIGSSGRILSSAGKDGRYDGSAPDARSTYAVLTYAFACTTSQ